MFIIAEAGVNHNGSMDLAFRLIEEAKACGADAVKFQTFKADRLAQRHTPKVPYQTKDVSEAHESHYEMLKKLELSDEQTIKVKSYCDDCGIEFMSTPYDPESVFFLQKIGVKRLKVASADLIDFQIQDAVRATGLPVIQSVGMATLEEIDDWNQQYLAFNPNYPRTLLQCTSNYPSDPLNANLKVMTMLSDRYSLPVGFSDHTPDHESAKLSVALGAEIIEKHFTLDKTMPGPDHKASLDPKGLREYCEHIKRSVAILGSSEKLVAEEEMNMRQISRKGVFLKRDVPKGHPIVLEDVYFRRPGDKMNMLEFKQNENRVLKHNKKIDEPLEMSDFI